MTIKQQGGVFGRNPSFNNVSIDTLTVDSSASVNGPLDCDGFTSNGQSNFVGTLGTVYVDSQGAYINFTRNSGNYIRTTGASSSLYINTALKNRIGIINTGDVLFYKDDGTTVGATWDASAGNLAFASGNGIDFSATSGTGTSELFDDYEEGTWTPGGFANLASTSITPGASATYAGSYTKIGDVVTCYFNVNLGTSSTSVALGDVWSLTGLPYASSGDFISGGGILTVYGSLGSNILAQIAVSTRSTTTYFRPIEITGSVNYAYPIRGFFSYKV